MTTRPVWTALMCWMLVACGLPEDEIADDAADEAALGVSDARDIKHYLMMDVCLDANGSVIVGMTPLDPGCTIRRDIRASDPIPYHLHNHPNSNCPNGRGRIAKENIPVVRNSVTRIVSTYDHGDDPACPGSINNWDFGSFESAADDGASIYFFDASYGFIMASNAQTDSYWLTPSYCPSNTNNSKRFFRGWIIGPRELPIADGTAGSEIFQTAHQVGTPPAQSVCPNEYTPYFVSWSHGAFVFQGGANLLTWVSNKYASTHPDGTSPGEAKQLERTLWTRELGLSRWEKWAREDLIDDDGRSAEELAEIIKSRGRCSKPFDMPRQISANYVTGDVIESTTYKEAAIDKHTGERRVWYMTNCYDYTNVEPESGSYAPEWEAFMSHIGTYWW